MMTEAMIRYSRSAMVFHWLIAVLLVFNHSLGGRTEDLPRGPELFAAFQLHKSIGILILFLSIWRLWIRIRSPRPVPVSDSGWATRLSGLVHIGFYIVMIGAPLTGWIIVSTSKIKIPTLLFGIIPWPHLPLGDAGRALHEVAEAGHGLMANLAILLFALHIIGAIRHQFILKDALIERMMPVSRAGIGAVAAALGLICGSFALARIIPLHTPPVSAPAKVPTMGTATVAPPPIITPAPADKAVDDEKPEADKKPDVEEVVTKTNDNKVVSGPVPVWQVMPGGRLGFSVAVNGEQVSGRFGRWDASITFDPERLAQSSLKATIDLASVTSGDSQRDDMLGGADFFSTAAHPRATFNATDIRAKGIGRYEARGILTLKGVSRPARLDFTLNIKGRDASANGSAQLTRGEFSIGTGQFEGDDTISRTVNVTFAFTARKVG
jgi:cytochrome b561/polyisoprenoid-binding protein YceI